MKVRTAEGLTENIVLLRETPMHMDMNSIGSALNHAASTVGGFAQGIAKGFENGFVTYNPLVDAGKAAVSAVAGDSQAAHKNWNHALENTASFAKGVPVVGQVIGGEQPKRE